MKKVKTRAWLFLFLLLAVSPSLVFSAEKMYKGSTFSVLVKEGLLSIRANKIPLKMILDEITNQTPIKIVYRGPAEEPVSVEFSGVALEKGIRRLNRDVDYVFIYGPPQKTDASPHGIKEMIVYSGADKKTARQTAEPPRPATTQRPVPQSGPESFVNALKSENPAVKNEAAARIQRMRGDTRLLNYLNSFFQSDETPENKAKVAEALKGFTDPVLRENISRALPPSPDQEPPKPESVPSGAETVTPAENSGDQPPGQAAEGAPAQ